MGNQIVSKTRKSTHLMMILMAYVTSEDSYETAHMRSLVRVFAVRTSKLRKYTKLQIKDEGF